MANPRFPSVDNDGKIRDAHLPTRLSPAALEAFLAKSAWAPGLGSRWVAFGDSLTSPSAGAPRGAGWVDYVRFRTEGRFYLLNNAGVSGNTTAQMLARLDADVLSYAPDVVTILGGTNDLTANVPLATYKSNITQIVDRIIDAGAAPVILSIPPRSMPDKKLAETGIFNGWLREFARDRNVHFVDIHAHLVDVATGGYKPEVGHTDGLHLSRVGAAVIGDTLIEQLSPWMPRNGIIQPAFKDDPKNLVTNGLLIDGPASAPTGWFFSAAGEGVTRGRVVDPDFLGGVAWETAITSPAELASPGFYVGDIKREWSVGDQLLFSCRFKLIGMDDFPLTGTDAEQGLSVSAQFYGASSGATQHLIQYLLLDGHHGVVHRTFTVPAGTDGLVQISTSFRMQAGKSGTMRVGDFSVINLSALGLA